MLYQLRCTLILTVSTFLLGGCAAETFGERLQSRGEQMSQLGANWQRGEKMIVNGQAKIERGKKLIAEGETMVAEGERLKGNAEIETQAAFPIPQ